MALPRFGGPGGMIACVNTRHHKQRNNHLTQIQKMGDAFKRSAVELWLRSGKSVESIAAELEMSAKSLKQWKKRRAALSAIDPVDL